MELTEAHIRRLQGVMAEGFSLIAFPLFPTYIGVQKYGCAALLKPLQAGRFQISAQPGPLIKGNISVLVERGGEEWFVWKSHQLRATKERLGQLRRFEEELRGLLEPPSPV